MSEDTSTVSRVPHNARELTISGISDPRITWCFERLSRDIPIPGKVTVTFMDKSIQAKSERVGIVILSHVPKQPVQVILQMTQTEAYRFKIKSRDLSDRDLRLLLTSSSAVSNSFFPITETLPAVIVSKAIKARRAYNRKPLPHKTRLDEVAKIGKMIDVAIELQRQVDRLMDVARHQAKKLGLDI